MQHPGPPDSATTTTENDYLLAAGDLCLKASAIGAGIRGLWREAAGAEGQREAIITGYARPRDQIGAQGDVLLPFPSRLQGGRYTFDGQQYQMPLNDAGANAIHGFLRHVPWQVVESRAETVTFTVSTGRDAYPGYPFPLRCYVTYGLDDQGMTCRFSVTNTGSGPAPVGAGFHPYFSVGSSRIDEDILHLPMERTLRLDTVAGTPLDFRQPRPIGDAVIDACYAGPLRDADGVLRVRLASPHPKGRAVTVWMDGAFDYVVVYSGDTLPQTPYRRRALAIEPLTCGSDAFNHPERGLTVLAPGESLSGIWGVTAE